jgi:hypothetical protein
MINKSTDEMIIKCDSHDDCANQNSLTFIQKNIYEWIAIRTRLVLKVQLSSQNFAKRYEKECTIFKIN